MDEVIIFDKSLQERLQEYLDVLSNVRIRTASNIKKEWSFYMEFSVDPNGWQAIWKIPRLTCEELKIQFPTIVLVYVEHVDFHALSAAVKIIAVQDEISLPEQHIVSLTQLWPTKEQDKTVALDIHTTANTLDMYRFFYTHLFLPWDYEDEEDIDWLNKHLECRLRLFFDMKNGVIPRAIGEHIRALLSEARKLQAHKEQIEITLMDSDVEEDNTNDERIQSLMEINVNIIQIKSELELLENPMTRNVIIKRQKELLPKNDDLKPQFWLVFEEGKIDECIALLNQIKKRHPNEVFKFASSLASVLKIVNPLDTIILSKSMHLIQSVSGLENGGCLKGIYEKGGTTVTSTNEDVMLDFKGQIVLENLTINASYSQCGILVRAGKTTLKNCKLIGDNTSSTHQGIIVLSGANLELIDCEISGFCTAIVGNSGSKISMENSEIFDANLGVKIYDFCQLKAQNCTFHDCREYGFCLETDSSVNGSQKIGNFEVLQVIPDISAKELSGRNNIKGDVLINQKVKIIPINDLFSNPENDPTKRKKTMSETSDEDMGADCNITVVEKNIGEAGDTQ